MTYMIHHYPVELIDVVHLANGRRVVVRPVLPQDGELHRNFFDRLSNESRYNRFLNPMQFFPAGMLERFTQVDYRQHFALVAETFLDNMETVVGEARYVAGEDRSDAEFAVAVADDFQGFGLGTLLLKRLVCKASCAGIRHLVGETLATNDNMLALAHKCGFTVRRDSALEYIMRLEKNLEADGRNRPCHEWEISEVGL